MPIKVDLAVACNYMQHHEWWSNVFTNILEEVQHGDITIGGIFASGTAVPDNAMNRMSGVWVHEGRRGSLTDVNRNGIVGMTVGERELPFGFWQSDAEWVFWLDDDTVQPPGAIRNLLALKRDIVAGLYFMGKPPFLPLAYLRTEEGFYRPLDHYTPGALVEVDAVGMGCTLIHKSVYQRIMEAHEVFQRPNASLVAVPNKDILEIDEGNDEFNTVVRTLYPTSYKYGETYLYALPLSRPGEDDNRPWPFYSMEYSRTEDLHFAELCANAGIKIYVDTTITCDHWKTKAVNYDTYKEHLHERQKVANT